MGKFRLAFVLLFYFAAVSAQPLKVTIDSISSNDSNSLKRKYTISYHIKNNTSQPISFFLHPNTLIANAASSMTLFAVYKIYQNGILQDMDGPFFEREFPEMEQLEQFGNYNSPEAKALIKKTNEKHKAEHVAMLENYHKNGGTNPDEKWIIRNQKLLQSKMTLQPGETKSLTIHSNWDRIRTVNNGDIEYYLNEKDHFEFELILDLKKTLFKDELSETEFTQIKKDPNFIEGIFASNKMDINFGE
ncbi:MAG TPA: hypothetical protein VK528_00125 [Flavobacterium sp.]|nr:hypothetical protein [Flavobacterium sp.]